MVDVAANLAVVRGRIAEACVQARRDPGSVSLVAVSKRQPVELVRLAYAAGQRDFGENYAQELRDKAADLADLPDLRWHAIGPLQANKVKYVCAAAHTFHALDRIEIARAIAERCPSLRCFVQVNAAGEATKHGVALDDTAAFVAALRDVPGLRIEGVTTLPPLDPVASVRAFDAVGALADRLGLPERSMGTTDDYALAIAHGATIVRVGRAIFGERPAR